MLLYEIKTDNIVNKEVIKINKTDFFVNYLKQDKLKELGYLLIDDSNVKFDTIYHYYDKVPSVYGDLCIIKYYKKERNLEEVKLRLINIVNDFYNPDYNVENIYIKINNINNCNTIDELINLNY